MPRHALVRHVLAQLPQADFGRIALVDPAQLLHLRCEGEVRAALAVGQRAAVHGAPAELFDDPVELLCQPRLADARRPEDGHEVRDRIGSDAFPDAAQDL